MIKKRTGLITPRTEHIPGQLTDRPQWVCWRLEMRGGWEDTYLSVHHPSAPSRGLSDSFAGKDYSGIRVPVAELRRRGLDVPGDVALACFGEIELASLLDPFLTVVKEPAYEVGRATMQLLYERLTGSAAPPRHHVLPVELVVRRSTRRR